MSIKEMETTIRELQELRRMKEELDAEITALEDRIKADMGSREQLTAGAFRVTWKAVTTSRLDSKSLLADEPDLCKRYMKQRSVRRFTVQ